MKPVVLLLILVSLVRAQDQPAEDPYAGTFKRDQVTLVLSGSKGRYEGTITVQGRKLPAKVTANRDFAEGSFEMEGRSYNFTLTPIAGGLELVAEGLKYRLQRAQDDEERAAIRDVFSSRAMLG